MRQVVLPRIRRLSRYRWPLLITFCVSVTAAFSLSPLVDIARPDAAVGATLRTPVLYDILAPASTILDAFTMLTPSQYWAVFALCGILFIGSGIVSDARSGRGFRALRTLRMSARFAGGTTAVIGIMLVVPRPMASLHMSDPNLVVVDFHSHTSASHDGRPGFDAEKNRAWHREAGFNAVYITDHRTFAGAIEGLEMNPATAGGGTVILPGVELRDAGEHPLLIGVDPRRTRITSPDWKGAAVETDGGSVPPILILSLPGNIDNVPIGEFTGTVRLAGIEIHDGSPRGIAQTERDRARIIGFGGERRLTLVSGSDNHGWAEAAPAWSVLRIPGWRGMTPPALDIAIRRTVIAGDPGATQVIARRTAATATRKWQASLGGIAVATLMLRTMSLRDRFSWIAWSWGLAIFPAMVSRTRRKRILVRRRANIRASRQRPLIEAAAAMEAAL